MDNQTGPTVSGPSIVLCGRCNAKCARDDLQSHDGDLLCPLCFQRMEARNPLAAGEIERPPQARLRSSKVRAEPRELTLSDYPVRSTGTSFPPDEQEEQTRNRLMQLEHELRRRPEDVALLTEIAETYDELGQRQEAALCRREIFTLDPSNPSLRGKMVAEGPKRSQKPATSIPFWEDIPGILAYPLRGRGLGMVIVGGLMFGFATWVARYSLLGWAITGLVFGYLWAYWFNVIASAGTGEKEPPDWPEFFDIWHSIIGPAIASFVCFCIPFGPTIALGLTILFGPLTLNPITIGLLIGSGLVGVITYPMVVMAYAMFHTLTAAANYKFIYASILRILPDYILFITAFCILGALNAAVGTAVLAGVAFFLPIPILGTLTLAIANSFVFIYFNLAAYRLMGHLYHQSMGRLGWFGETTEPEKSLNLGVVVAGVTGLGVVCVIGFGAIMIAPALLVTATGIGDLPFEDGGYLEFAEFDSNYGHSKLRYEIRQVPEGFRFSGFHMSTRDRNPIPDFVVDSRGRFVDGTTDMQSGPIFNRLARRSGRTHTIFVGPTSGITAGPHVNGYTILRKVPWKGYDVIQVDDRDGSTRLMFDRNTGYLVGVEAPSIGREMSCVLIDTNIPGLRIPPEARELR
ncbi:MAG: hypothetical protein O7H41_02600 [Planctomycetota bacterium]|nr:hypothetical protein [Planctomycetota bacterium]